MAVYLTGSSDCLTSDNTVVVVQMTMYSTVVVVQMAGSSDCLTSDSTVVVVHYIIDGRVSDRFQ